MGLNKYTKKELIWIIEEMQKHAHTALDLAESFEEEGKSPYQSIGAMEYTLKEIISEETIQDMVEFRRIVE